MGRQVTTVAAVPPMTLVLAVVALLALVALGVVLARGRGAAARAEQLRQELRALGRRLDAVGDLTGTGLLVQSSDGRVLELDDRAARLLGLASSGAVVGRSVADLPVALVDDAGRSIHPGAVLGRPRATGHGDGDVVGAGGPGTRGAVVVGVSPQGSPGAVRRVRVQTRPLPPSPGTTAALLTALWEVGGPGGDRSGTALHDVAQAAPVALALAEPEGRVLEANRAFAQLVGASLEAVPDVDLGADPAWADAVATLRSGGGPRVTVEQRWARSDGGTVSVVLDVALVLGATDGAERVAVVARDVTADRAHSDQLTHRALHDPLTGLANRALLMSTLEDALRQPGAADRVAVLACDLDGFKPINDRYGHAAGDEVLVHVAEVLRAATGARGTVARLGGDEFVVVVDAPDGARAAQDVAGRIHAGLRQPMQIQRNSVPVRASVGVGLASSPTPGPGARGLLAAADAALYRAKGGGRSRTEVYDPAVDHEGSSAGLAGALPAALERGQLVLHLQPVVDLADGRVAGEEALVRWQHPEQGLLPPSAFGRAVQQAGLVAAVTRHVLARAVDHLARTADDGRWVAVPVEVDGLGDEELVTSVLADLAERGVAPGRLVVELGGTAPVDVRHRLRRDVGRLRAAGVLVLVDRFGSGAATLASLRDLPVDGIKLDASFTTGVVDDPGAARVISALGAMAREMDLVTVADGVDSAEGAQVLRDAGWRYGQGWAFGGPQPPTYAA